MSHRGDTKIFNRPICVDDYGTEVYVCHWTKKLVWADEAILLGSFYPGIHGVYVSAPDSHEARRNSHRAFNEMDRNCNTCKHLKRIKFDPVGIVRVPLVKDGKPAGFRDVRVTSGFIPALCTSTPLAHPYPVTFDGQGPFSIKFHPDDAMNMPCYEPRDPWRP